MDDSQAIADFWRVAEKNEPKPENTILSKKKQTADDMALRDNKPMVVVNMGNGAYEIYPKSVAVKWGREWEYDTEGTLL